MCLRILRSEIYLNQVTNSVVSRLNSSVKFRLWIVRHLNVSIEYLTNPSIVTGGGMWIYTHNATHVDHPVIEEDI